MKGIVKNVNLAFSNINIKKTREVAACLNRYFPASSGSAVVTGVPVCVSQNPTGQSQSLAAPCSHAETAGRLPAAPHHSKRPPQVRPEKSHLDSTAWVKITGLGIDENRLLPSDFYEDAALMLEEEGAVIVGLLVGLNVIDANLCVKGEDLDSQVTAFVKTAF